MSGNKVERNSNATSVPRRIALIRGDTPARVLEDREETMLTAPHLLLREVVLVQVCVIVLALISLFFDAPLEAIANPYRTPNPAKAPWYFLGLQELLHYFPPIVAGVILPFMVVVAIVIIPYFRMNIDAAGFYDRPWRRKYAAAALVFMAVTVVMAVYRVWAVVVPTVAMFGVFSLPALPFCPRAWRRRLALVPLANWIMTWFVVVVVVLTGIGVLFRGPGWEWIWPWKEGIY